MGTVSKSHSKVNILTNIKYLQITRLFLNVLHPGQDTEAITGSYSSAFHMLTLTYKRKKICSSTLCTTCLDRKNSRKDFCCVVHDMEQRVKLQLQLTLDELWLSLSELYCIPVVNKIQLSVDEMWLSLRELQLSVVELQINYG